jgi:hypothetical protein
MPFVLESSKRGFYPGDRPKINDRDYRMDESLFRSFQGMIEGMYGTPVDSYHDVLHITRGLVLTTPLIGHRENRGVEIDKTVVFWSMVLHDVGSNGQDSPDHGQVGAALIAPFVRVSPFFTPQQAEQIIANVQWHNKPFRQIPIEIHTPEFAIFTNADALELVRMEDGRNITLTQRYAWGFTHIAQELFEKTKNAPKGREFDTVMSVACEMGLVIA